MRKLMIAAMSSGSGKTIVTAGLLMALKQKNIAVRAFKCGPDYIDPMFHTRVLGVPCRNLDLFLLGGQGVLREVNRRTENEDCIVLEGAMGFYDGIGGTTEASAYELARLVRTPVLLVVKSRGQSATLAAQICGMMNFRKENYIAGVILNECSERLSAHLGDIIERECGVPVLGYLPKMEEADIESRHLGLLTAGEIPCFREKFEAIAEQMARTVDIDRILAIADVPWRDDPSVFDSRPDGCREAACRIAVARDEAFSFYYETSLDALRRAGALLVPFSPIRDRCLPDRICGLYLGGGYPEKYAEELSANVSMRQSICTALSKGMPTVAECGGFMYLQKKIEGMDGEMYEMAGALPGEAVRTPRLLRFGYVTLTPRSDSMLFRAGEKIPAHEFHHWDSTSCGDALRAEKHDGRSWRCGFAGERLYAGFPHLELGGEAPLADRFVDAAKKYSVTCVRAGMREVEHAESCDRDRGERQK